MAAHPLKSHLFFFELKSSQSNSVRRRRFLTRNPRGSRWSASKSPSSSRHPPPGSGARGLPRNHRRVQGRRNRSPPVRLPRPDARCLLACSPERDGRDRDRDGRSAAAEIHVHRRAVARGRGRLTGPYRVAARPAALTAGWRRQTRLRPRHGVRFGWPSRQRPRPAVRLSVRMQCTFDSASGLPKRLLRGGDIEAPPLIPKVARSWVLAISGSSQTSAVMEVGSRLWLRARDDRAPRAAFPAARAHDASRAQTR